MDRREKNFENISEEPVVKPFFEIGTRVYALRRSGELEPGWEVVSFDPKENLYLLQNEKITDGKGNVAHKYVHEEQLRELQAIAKKIERRIDKRLGETSVSHEETLVDRQELLKQFQIEINEIDGKESEAILDMTEIHGDELKGERINKEILKEEGLGPKFQAKIGDLTVWFCSNPYGVHERRPAIVGYVYDEATKKVIARSYYLSRSQGVWRYLPEYEYNEERKKPTRYWKGFSEPFGDESVSLPASFQLAIAEITAKSKGPVKTEKSELIFFGNAFKREFFKKDDSYLKKVWRHGVPIPGDFSADVRIDETHWGQKIPPEEMGFKDSEDEPDFNSLLGSASCDSPLYGKITHEIFPSKNNHFIFTFCREPSGMAWVGSVENNSPLTSIGLKEQWVRTGDLTTPPYEYEGSGGGYEDLEDQREEYVGMYKNYVSKIPIVQKYLKSLEKRK